MITINGTYWSIVLVSPQHYMLQKTTGDYTIGVCDDNTKAIYINDTLSPQMFKKVLCHEITHAAMFSYNIDLSLEQEEILADLVATFGQEIIRKTNNVYCTTKRDGLLN